MDHFFIIIIVVVAVVFVVQGGSLVGMDGWMLVVSVLCSVRFLV